jgi:hypothetical protein
MAILATLMSPILAVLYLIQWKRNDLAYRWFTLYLVVVGVIQLWQFYLVNIADEMQNLHLFKYYLLLEFVTLSMCFRYLLAKKWISVVMWFMILFLVLQYWIYPELMVMYNPLGIWLSHCLLFVYALMHLYRSLSIGSSFVLISGGFVVYLMGSAVAFSAGNIYMDVRIPKDIVVFLASINSLLYFGLEVLIAFIWWKNYSKRRIHS